MRLEYVCADPDAVRESGTLVRILSKFNEAQGRKVTPDQVFSDYNLARTVWEFAKPRLTANVEQFEQLSGVIEDTLRQIRAVDVNRKIAPEEVCKRVTYFGLTPALDYMLSTQEHRGVEFMGSIHPTYTAALQSITEGDVQLLERAVVDKLMFLIDLHSAFRTGQPTFEVLMEKLRSADVEKKKSKKGKPEDPADPACRPGICA